MRRSVAEGIVGDDVPCVIATGSGWDESVTSIDWQAGELLALGSSAVGPPARVLLGSRAGKRQDQRLVDVRRQTCRASTNW